MKRKTLYRIKNIVAFVCLFLMIVSGVWYYKTGNSGPFCIFFAVVFFLFLAGWMLRVAEEVMGDLNSENEEGEGSQNQEPLE